MVYTDNAVMQAGDGYVCDWVTIVSGGKYVQWRFDIGEARFRNLTVVDTGGDTDLGDWGFWWLNAASVQLSYPVGSGLLIYGYFTLQKDLVDGQWYILTTLEDDGIPNYTDDLWRWGIGLQFRPVDGKRLLWGLEYRMLNWNVQYSGDFRTGGVVFQIGCALP